VWASVGRVTGESLVTPGHHCHNPVIPIILTVLINIIMHLMFLRKFLIILKVSRVTHSSSLSLTQVKHSSRHTAPTFTWYRLAGVVSVSVQCQCPEVSAAASFCWTSLATTVICSGYCIEPGNTTNNTIFGGNRLVYKWDPRMSVK